MNEFELKLLFLSQRSMITSDCVYFIDFMFQTKLIKGSEKIPQHFNNLRRLFIARITSEPCNISEQ